MEFLKKNRIPLAIVFLVVVAWSFLRTPATPIASVEELDARLSTGRPVVLEFFANT